MPRIGFLVLVFRSFTIGGKVMQWTEKRIEKLMFVLKMIFFLMGSSLMVYVIVSLLVRRNYQALLGSIFLIAWLILFFWGFKAIAEERRYLTQVFGAYYRTLDSGLRWIFPFIEKIRTFISIQEQRYPLFEGERVMVDFIDGSAKPKDAFVFVQCRIIKSDPDIGDGKDSTAPYKMVYGIRNVREATITLIENAVRSYLNSLTIDEGLRSGRGGFNIFERMPQQEQDSIVQELRSWGLRIFRVTIADFELDKTVVKAREDIIRTESAKKAAKHERVLRSEETMGTLIENLHRATGKSVKAIQQEIQSNPDLRERFVAIGADLTHRRMAIDAQSLTDIRVSGAEGLEKTLLNLMALWQKGSTKGGRASTSASKGQKGDKKEEDEENE